ncbi:DUF1971 domain-containing protein [Okeania sp. SIO2G5]|uniref:DUF1971 domain-containing protein n=1 Tax=Okeania sp. SIO2G5 TaxID=2607796 RepID=UPI0013C087B0|nr:DUF1971 domain-containing protein [Okeania sp. SIO2G5]NEP76600.1 DUF1971 domain-containing protein [Okeania sp. SIO2G5]
MSDALALHSHREIAPSLVKYKTLPTWAESTLPEAFQTRHNTKQGTWGKIIAPVSSSAFPCPIDFPSTFSPQELRDYYSRWHIVDHQEQLGTLHRKDSNCNPYESMFATLLAQKST